MIDVLTKVCNKIWKTVKMTNAMDSVADLHSLKGLPTALTKL